ncbi:4'-phosphopantetheinyl transferase family protein [Leisingera methylohalidivorans]|uniref:Enterobactin synthase component D n=1 Tax=Leisingera methylohalidivorans DSM 14336 TaxID=999552 RepID=V9VXT3_9RHOB|nr:4'-phosphopantetheinyl transferase superfamily protein [Leisingera methylohalidivorans]AHD01687.1 phosphopantetheinyl transferase [Leisingera methylohalidivorans DSM 14336]
MTEAENKLAERLDLMRLLIAADVAVAGADPLAALPVPFAQEAAGLSPNAAAKRRNEFAAGRSAAHLAMKQLGLPPVPVPVGSDRAPVWPEGLVGSLTHTKSCAMAVLARTGDVQALGIDIEEDTPLKDELLPAICSEREQAWLRRQDNPGQMAKVIFSAKEAAYKCQYTLSRAFYGFDGMELEFDLAAGAYQAVFTAGRPPFARGEAVGGRFAIGAGLIITTAEIRGRG